MIEMPLGRDPALKSYVGYGTIACIAYGWITETLIIKLANFESMEEYSLKKNPFLL
ncbi:MAG TPA: hypothetical protein VN455_01210 [Methanotrichaceae archaeon]|nr:hypothetical protein [Methanotrichaceae archaeon]